VAGAIKIVLDFLCRVCVTGLPECGLGCGYDLAYGSDLVGGHGRWIYFVRTLVGWFIL